MCASLFHLPMCASLFHLPMCASLFHLPMCASLFHLPMCASLFHLPMCASLWRRRLSLLRKAFSQPVMLQVNGLSPLWVSICALRFPEGKETIFINDKKLLSCTLSPNFLTSFTVYLNNIWQCYTIWPCYQKSLQAERTKSNKISYLSGYLEYFREPHWLSMGLLEISRVTWQV